MYFTLADCHALVQRELFHGVNILRETDSLNTGVLRAPAGASAYRAWCYTASGSTAPLA